jgi:hypothetical protein
MIKMNWAMGFLRGLASSGGPKDQRKLMGGRYYLLLFYFIAIISASIFLLIVMWSPIPSLRTLNNQSITGPGNHTAVTTISQNLTAKTMTVTSNISSANNKILKKNYSQAYEPLARSPMNDLGSRLDFSYFEGNHDTRLLIISVLFGILGSCVYGLTSITAWRRVNRLENSYGGFYLSQPFVGPGLAVMVYLLLRAGLLSGGPSVTTDFAVAAVSGLVGLTQKQITKKLKDVFDTLFGIEKHKDTADELDPDTQEKKKGDSADKTGQEPSQQ